MRSIISNFFKISLSVLLLYGCNLSSPEEIVEVSETSDVLSIPAGFDFSTHQEVTINIVENATYAKYDVFAYPEGSNETDTDLDDTGKLIFSGVPNNGILKQTINVPKYYTKVYIRRNENQNISASVKEIVNKEVNYNSSEAKNSSKSTTNKNTANTDSDGDGIFDQDDAYPNNPEVAFEYFTPSKDGVGTIAFEDSWPSTGDYDFNDVAFHYRTTVFLNADNLAVGFDFMYQVISNRAGNMNGIGFEIEGIAPDKIKSVSGASFRYNFISRNANGTEANQENAVIILTDAVRFLRKVDYPNGPRGWTHLGYNIYFPAITVSVKFNKPLSTADLGVAPFNPFLIRTPYHEGDHANPNYPDYKRNHEIHLPNRKPTSLGISSEGTGYNSNEDRDSNYISKSGYPWAISIIEETGNSDSFRLPRDTKNITEVYNFFSIWAESGGNEFKNWYTNAPGNRNTSL